VAHTPIKAILTRESSIVGEIESEDGDHWRRDGVIATLSLLRILER
jgi:hypothetical protein